MQSSGFPHRVKQFILTCYIDTYACYYISLRPVWWYYNYRDGRLQIAMINTINYLSIYLRWNGRRIFTKPYRVHYIIIMISQTFNKVMLLPSNCPSRVPIVYAIYILCTSFVLLYQKRCDTSLTLTTFTLRTSVVYGSVARTAIIIYSVSTRRAAVKKFLKLFAVLYRLYDIICIYF